MIEYKAAAPSSRVVSVGRSDNGEQQAAVSYNGPTASQANSAGAIAYAAVLANLEPMVRHSQWIVDQINARGSTVDPMTGELSYLRSEGERKRLMLLLQQNDQTIAYQRAQAVAAAAKADASAAAGIAAEQTSAAERAAVEKRAREIALENKAQSLARKLTIR